MSDTTMSMTDSLVPRRDYSLTGPEARRAVEIGPCLGRVVSFRGAAQGDEGADAAHATGRRSATRCSGLALLVVSAGAASDFWGTWWCVPFWIVYGVLYGSACDSPLARMRPRHRLPHPVDERRGLSDRQLHGDAQSGELALEPCAPPHRHDHRRPRSRDRLHAPGRASCRRSLHFVGILDIWHCAEDPAAQRRRQP